MQHTLNRPPLAAAGLEANPAFNVVIAYEDFETGKHAKKTYDFLVEHLGRDCCFSNQMWKFDVLSIPKLRDIAVKDAATADILLISSHGVELPPHIKEWIEAWLAEPHHCLALVALFDRSREEAALTRSVRNYLAEVAKRGQMEFFAQPDEWPGRHDPQGFLGIPRASKLNGKTFHTLAGVVQQEVSIPRWGINE